MSVRARVTVRFRPRVKVRVRVRVMVRDRVRGCPGGSLGARGRGGGLPR